MRTGCVALRRHCCTVHSNDTGLQYWVVIGVLTQTKTKVQCATTKVIAHIPLSFLILLTSLSTTIIPYIMFYYIHLMYTLNGCFLFSYHLLFSFVQMSNSQKDLHFYIGLSRQTTFSKSEYSHIGR